MNKQEFLTQLCNGLSGLPKEDIEERLNFFSEMIDDRMEEGLSEEEAVKLAGSVDEIVAQTVAEIPLAKIAKERISPKRQLRVWELVLIIVGSPIWLSLAIAVIAVIFSVYVSLWAVIISLWSVFVALAVSALACILSSAITFFIGNVFTSLGLFSAGLICAGLSIFMFFGCKAISKCILQLTKKFAIWIKNCFIKKEEL
ncbi:MAG: DUF1700 domain-containing protein [Acutalibacteraceae bacterium]